MYRQSIKIYRVHGLHYDVIHFLNCLKRFGQVWVFCTTILLKNYLASTIQVLKFIVYSVEFLDTQFEVFRPSLPMICHSYRVKVRTGDQDRRRKRMENGTTSTGRLRIISDLCDDIILLLYTYGVHQVSGNRGRDCVIDHVSASSFNKRSSASAVIAFLRGNVSWTGSGNSTETKTAAAVSSSGRVIKICYLLHHQVRSQFFLHPRFSSVFKNEFKCSLRKRINGPRTTLRGANGAIRPDFFKLNCFKQTFRMSAQTSNSDVCSRHYS